jgi:hypothetical protein
MKPLFCVIFFALAVHAEEDSWWIPSSKEHPIRVKMTVSHKNCEVVESALRRELRKHEDVVITSASPDFEWRLLVMPVKAASTTIGYTVSSVSTRPSFAPLLTNYLADTLPLRRASTNGPAMVQAAPIFAQHTNDVEILLHDVYWAPSDDVTSSVRNLVASFDNYVLEPRRKMRQENADLKRESIRVKKELDDLEQIRHRKEEKRNR